MVAADSAETEGQRATRGPLAGLRVVELGGIGPVPFCGMMLADLGADVIMLEKPGVLRAIRHDRDVMSRGKRSVLVDLKQPRGSAVARRLLEVADVALEGFRPGVAERLGVGPEAVQGINQRLVYGRMTGWGQTGPLAASAGHDINYIALTGALHAIGRAGGPPQVPLNLLGDFGGGGAFLTIGVLAALTERDRSGRGQVIDASIVDGTLSLCSMLVSMIASGIWTEERGVNMLDSGAPYYDVYETRDGKHLAVGAIEPQFFSVLLRKLGAGDDWPAQTESERWPELRARLAASFRTRDRDDWAAEFEGSDACVTPVLTLEEARCHPHLLARGTFVDAFGFTHPAPAPRFSRTAARLTTGPPEPGQHTMDALTSWGLTDAAELLRAEIRQDV